MGKEGIKFGHNGMNRDVNIICNPDILDKLISSARHFDNGQNAVTRRLAGNKDFCCYELL